ncbi:MAG: ubiquinone/menaquinone biosynthesis methyltransferase, partial [Deltaproteobacteria bacterium]|nr:ubiquinone/menaquinone biosynthesis methyltransferase [Deltaproteobacteria bacterium]
MAYTLPVSADKPAYVRKKFDEIAGHYDLFNDLITQGQHRWWKRVLVNRLPLGPGVRGLDICCGTGDLARRALGRLPADGLLVAADFSANMLRIARKRLAGGGGKAAPHLVAQADAMALPFADASFHFVTIGYGLRNVAGLPGCLEELLRVLRPGGVLASLDIGKVRPRWLRPFADAYLFRVVPLIGRLLQGGQDMYTYLPHSTLDFPHQDELKKRMLDAGFAQVDLVE